MSSGKIPHAVMWDMDGTLLDMERLWDAALYAEAARLGAHLDANGRAHLVGASMDDTALFLLALAGIDATPQRIRGVNLRIRADVSPIFRQPLPWRPGARDALATVRAAGIPCALVTSTERAFVIGALATLGRDNFNAIVCGDEVMGLNKPHRYPYIRAADLLGVDPANCVAIEDSAAGSDAAVDAGCAVIVVPHDAPVPPSPRTVHRKSLVGLDIPTLIHVLTHHRT